MHCGILSEHPANTRFAPGDNGRVPRPYSFFAVIRAWCTYSALRLCHSTPNPPTPPTHPTTTRHTHTPLSLPSPRVPFTLHPSTGCPLPPSSPSCFRCARTALSGTTRGVYPSKPPGQPPTVWPGFSPPFCAMSPFGPLCSQPSVSKRMPPNEPPKPEKQERNN